MYEKKEKNIQFLFYGGHEKATRTLAFLFPTMWNEQMLEKNYERRLGAIRICLSRELNGQYGHNIYLSGLMKLGVKREKCGDILVREDGADLIVVQDMIEYIQAQLTQLTRFSKAKIERIPLAQVQEVSEEREVFRIVIPSLRLDSIVSELAKISRTKAEELLLQERVFVNYKVETKGSKLIQGKDIVTIRGKGKFEIGEMLGTTRKQKVTLEVKKY